MIRVLFVDDHTLVRRGLAALFVGSSTIEIVGDVGSGEEALAALPTLQPQVIVMDVTMPGMGGIAATRAIRSAHPQCQVVMLTEYPHYVIESLLAGACGYVLKTAQPNDLEQAIQAAKAGNVFLYPGVHATVATELMHAARILPRMPTFTDAEMTVLQLLADGVSNRRIGMQLGYNENAVKKLVQGICRKLHARDRTHAVSVAKDRNLI